MKKMLSFLTLSGFSSPRRSAERLRSGRLAILLAAAAAAASGAAADVDCLPHKVSPAVSVAAPEWKKSVVQPLRPMDLLHGNVIATMVEDYSLEASAEPMEDGFCIVLRRVAATIGYNDFLVQIDSRHAPDSCGYNITLEHEDQHIRAHLSIIDDMHGEITRVMSDAANSVMPAFARTQADADSALDKFNAEMQTNPAVVLIKQKIAAEQEMRNKKIDQMDDGRRAVSCGL